MGDNDDFSADYADGVEECEEEEDENFRLVRGVVDYLTNEADRGAGSSRSSTDRAVSNSRGMTQERLYVGEAAQLNKC